ncbi:MAG: alpha/beta fold hydrolase [Nannocystaceae bacterium]
MSPTQPGDTASFELGAGDHGALLLHGLTGSPWDMRPIGDALAAAGVRVVCPRLAGHENVHALERSNWRQWYEEAEWQFDRLCQQCTRRIVVGFSMGALLTLRMAVFRNEQIAGIVAMSVPLELPKWQRAAIGTLSRLRCTPGIGRFVGNKPKHGGVDVRIRWQAERSPSLPAFPYPALRELVRLQADVRSRLPQITSPLLLLHGRFDHAAPMADSARVSQRVGSAQVRRVILPRSFHILPLDLDAERTCVEVVAFARQAFTHPSASRGPASP